LPLCPFKAPTNGRSDNGQIRHWLSAFGIPRQVALRCRIVPAAAADSDLAIAQQLQINRKTVTLWRTRYRREGLKSLWEIAPGRERKPAYGPETIQAIVDTTLRTKPKGRTQWSCRPPLAPGDGQLWDPQNR